jgi:hypothetical protein|tara:strand:+ start:739 stop:963 length:225 start_codon:yes stop_codon:yes gene_type:complete
LTAFDVHPQTVATKGNRAWHQQQTVQLRPFICLSECDNGNTNKVDKVAHEIVLVHPKYNTKLGKKIEREGEGAK